MSFKKKSLKKKLFLPRIVSLLCYIIMNKNDNTLKYTKCKRWLKFLGMLMAIHNSLGLKVALTTFCTRT